MAGDYVRGYVRDSAVGMVTKLTINLGLLGLLRCFAADYICCNLRTFLGKVFLRSGVKNAI